jgi:hypothetical protein
MRIMSTWKQTGSGTTVKNPFRKRGKDRAEPSAAAIEDPFKEWETRFSRLEQAIERINARFPQVTIENIHIHQPVLEKLEFRLDGLDIEHLSGSLNLGNNFGTKVAPSPSAKTTAEPKTDLNHRSNDAELSGKRPGLKESAPGLHSTPSGFRLNNRR